jgi:hypothetical protein
MWTCPYAGEDMTAPMNPSNPNMDMIDAGMPSPDMSTADMTDMNTSAMPTGTSRAERLARQRDAFMYWARTATTDDPPAELPDPPAGV